MKFDEYAAQVSLGTLSPSSQEEWIALVDAATEPPLLSRLFVDYFVPRESQEPSPLSPLSTSAWSTLMMNIKRPQSPSPSHVDNIVLHILGNPCHDLSVFESMLETGQLGDRHVNLIAFSNLVTASVVEKWNSLYPIVLTCNSMQLKRVFEKHPQQILHYAGKQLSSLVVSPSMFPQYKFDYTDDHGILKDYRTYTGTTTDPQLMTWSMQQLAKKEKKDDK